MHVNVSHILAGEVGESADFELAGENPNIPDLELVAPIQGQVRVRRLDSGVGVRGRTELAFRLQCFRCLDDYDHRAEVSFEGVYAPRPAEDEWPISARGIIDLTPLIRQEAIVSIPMQQLCRTDCEGLCPDCGERLIAGHHHSTQDPAPKPTDKKG